MLLVSQLVWLVCALTEASQPDVNVEQQQQVCAADDDHCTAAGQLCPAQPPVVWADHKWLQMPNRPIKVYSAFYDDRTGSEWPFRRYHYETDGELDAPGVRIIAHGLQAAYNEEARQPVYCHVRYRESTEWEYVAVASWIKIYTSTVHHDEYTAHLLHCALKLSGSEERPTAIGVSENRCGPEPIVALNINYAPDNAKGTLSICCSPLHSELPAVRIAEFVAIYSRLGAQHFTFYVHHTSIRSRDVHKLLASYERDGLASVLPWPVDRHQHKYFYYDQRSALNDCIYRNRGHYTHSAVIDLDEIMLPIELTARAMQRHAYAPTDIIPLTDLIQDVIVNVGPVHYVYLAARLQWTTVLQDYDNMPVVGSLCFQHLFVHPQPTDDDDDSQRNPLNLITQSRYTMADRVFPLHEVRSKCIHRNDWVQVTDIHTAQWMHVGVNGAYKQVMLSQDKAVLLHYRPQWMSVFDKQDINFVPNNTMFRFEPQLTNSIKRRFDKAGIAD